MNDLFGIQGLHVLVTGGSSGLGRFFATFLAARGARVTVGARRAGALTKTVDDIAAAKGQAQSVVMDVTVGASIASALDTAEARFGPIQIAIKEAAGQALIKRIPQRRLGELRELEGPLLLLASEAGSYMTGSVIVADGGHVVSTL